MPWRSSSEHDQDPIIDTQKAALIDSTVIDKQQIGVAAREPFSKWRTTMTIGATLALAVLSANIGILVWANSLPSGSEDGIVKVFEGSCRVTEGATIAADLAINILSTLLLGASNHNAQLLSAPTRKDLDKQHARGGWLDIGVSSVRNLRFLARWRTLIWVMLLLSTVPLHLVYNSVIFTARSAVDYKAALVTNDFILGGWWDHDVAGMVTPPDLDQLMQIQKHAGNLTRLDHKACLQAYATSMYGMEWRNALIVTSLPSNNSTMINVYEHKAASAQSDLGWACDGDVHTLEYLPYPACGATFLGRAARSWTIPNVPGCPASGTRQFEYNIVNSSAGCGGNDDYYDAPVEYCLAESFPPHCTISVSTKLLTVVIVCNVVKILCMAATLSARNFRPLVNIGDAIASFLNRPDHETARKGALEVSAVSSGVWRSLDRHTPLPWTRRKRRWWYAVPGVQLNLTFFVCFLGWLTAMVALVVSVKSSQTDPFSTFGAINTSNLIQTSLGAGLVANVVLANTPQLVITLIYIFYNDALTRMLMSLEYAQFATTRKALRVSRPRGQQRSTYWLQLPYRYSIPMMISMVLLHWLVSRSIYLVRLTIYDNTGQHVADRDINACGFSPLAILMAFCLTTALIVVLVTMGRFRHINAGMPTASSCSVAISAAAHIPEFEPGDAATLPLQYGVVPGTAIRALQYGGQARDNRPQEWNLAFGFREHVSFSSGKVVPLKNGVIYW